MADIDKTLDDFDKDLGDLVKNSISLCTEYDKGNQGIAKLIALTIRVLVHDTPSSTSLLTHLNSKSIKFYDTAFPFNPKNLLTQQLLVFQRITADTKSSLAGNFFPLLDEGPPIPLKEIEFEDWWAKNVILCDNSRKEVTRKNLVLKVCNKEGGAHVDKKVEDHIYKLMRENTSNFKLHENGSIKDFENTPALPSIRQIGYEVLLTLKKHFPYHFKDI